MYKYLNRYVYIFFHLNPFKTRLPHAIYIVLNLAFSLNIIEIVAHNIEKNDPYAFTEIILYFVCICLDMNIEADINTIIYLMCHLGKFIVFPTFLF